MNIKWQALILTFLILVSVTLSRIGGGAARSEEPAGADALLSSNPSPNVSFLAALQSREIEVKKVPGRRWEVLDPPVKAEAVLIQSLDDNLPFLYLNTYKSWPMASLTKLLTALVVFEDIGENKKILVDEEAILTEGEAGNFRSGETYSARDLLKIMFLTSSNDAAAAFERHLGFDEFVRILNEKARKLGMSGTFLYDASGLSDLNRSTASDLLRLSKYTLENHPAVFSYTRIANQLIQPLNLNNLESRIVYNINSLVNEPYFLGGKTGTSEKARENLVALVSLKDKRVIVIILGSPNRNEELKTLMNWVTEAYIF